MNSKNWFDTLNQALEAEKLLDTWDCLWSSIAYGETRRYSYPLEYQTPTGRSKTKWHHVSIYREDTGQYERPVHYTL